MIANFLFYSPFFLGGHFFSFCTVAERVAQNNFFYWRHKSTKEETFRLKALTMGAKWHSPKLVGRALCGEKAKKKKKEKNC